MKWKAYVPLAVALVLGLFAARMAMNLVGVEAPKIVAATNFTPIVVAGRDIEAGTALAETDLATMKVDSNALPDNATVMRAVIEYQQLFGGSQYRSHLRHMRRTALQVMRGLSDFQPRLVGAAVSGAAHAAHRVQLHVFHEKAEALDIFLHDRGLAYEAGDRRYRYADGREREIPLVSFEAEGMGVDIAVFPIDEQRRAPLNPADGLAYQRLDTAAVEALLQNTQ